MKQYEFKASNVEQAIEKGLAEQNLTRENAEIEVITKEGFLSKAVVKVCPKKVEEKAEAETQMVEESSNTVAEETTEDEGNFTDEEKTNQPRGEKWERRPRERDRDHSRARTDRPDYDTEEKRLGKEYLERIAGAFSDKFRVDAKQMSDELCLYISGDDAQVFIGHRGETLDAIQYVVNQLVNKDKPDGKHMRVTVDADFYRERRKRTLTALAKKLAHNAFEGKKEIVLEPMNSYERRIIHAALQTNDEATTRSEGEGKDRHIVVVPKCEILTFGTSNDFRKKGPSRTKKYGYNKRKF